MERYLTVDYSIWEKPKITPTSMMLILVNPLPYVIANANPISICLGDPRKHKTHVIIKIDELRLTLNQFLFK